MKFFKSIIVLWISFLLFFIYIFIDKNVFFVLTNWKTISRENYSYDLESLRTNFTYSAENIFESGYKRETEAGFYSRLSTFSTGKPLENGSFTLTNDQPEAIVKVTLPDGFEGGILSIRTITRSKFKVGVSFDLNNWKFSEYPGFTDLTYNIVNLDKTNEKYAYLKFVPSLGEELRVNFSIFQYVSKFFVTEDPSNKVLFYPETDIDYQGKEIIRQGVMYGNKTN